MTCLFFYFIFYIFIVSDLGVTCLLGNLYFQEKQVRETYRATSVRNWRVKTSRVKERDFPKEKATITLDDRRESDNTIIADAVKWMKVNK